MLQLDYELGLNKLEKALPEDDLHSRSAFYVFKAQLIDYLEQASRYGSDSIKEGTYKEIIFKLGELAENLLGIHFIDLCQDETTQHSSSSPQATSESELSPLSAIQPWRGGAEINIRDERYCIYDPVEEIWSSDRSFVERKAKTQQLQTNRKVWIKQIHMFRPSSKASALYNTLEQEARILQGLEQEVRSTFPRLLNSYRSKESVTLIYTATQGSPLKQIFGPKDVPLEPFSARTLLRSIHPLCAMLDMLHRRHLSHRNLSPETILVQNGQAVLQDVGLAARRFEPGEGPPLYQAPEQVRLTRNLDVPGPHTDIYQLGMILYHILTGRLPLSPLPDIPPADWNNAITQDLYLVIRRARELAAKDRWPTMRAFSNAIRDTMK